MESTSWAVVAVSLLAAAAAIFLSKTLTSRRRRRQLKYPPGPKPWPIIGNFNLIGPLPHQSLHQLSKKYGPLMQLQFGSFPVIVASSAEMAKLILKTNDQIFASRPQLAAGDHTTYNYSNILWAPYGPYWRLTRRICLTELFSSKRLQSYEYIRAEEMRGFVSRLNAIALSGEPVVVKTHLARLNLSIVSRIMLGKKYFSEPEFEQESIVTLEEFEEMLDELFLLNGVLNIGDWIPWLRFLDLQGYVKRMKAVSKRFDKFHDHVFDEHKERKKVAKNDFEAKDMVDVLMELADDPDNEVKLNYDCLKGFTQDLIAGGTDTSATTVEWAMSELLKQPHLISKVTEELDKVVGKDRWVEEKDFPQLPFLDAVVKETMRLRPAAVFLAPHLALQDCNVAGYHVRKGSRVFVNLWSIGRDSSVWDQPEQFRPQRFMEKPIDVKGHSFELLPFGSGRRMCPGYSLGLKMIYSSLANMLHGFDWKLAGNMKPEELSMEEVYGLTSPRKFPLVGLARPRLPTHLY